MSILLLIVGFCFLWFIIKNWKSFLFAFDILYAIFLSSIISKIILTLRITYFITKCKICSCLRIGKKRNTIKMKPPTRIIPTDYEFKCLNISELSDL